MGSIVAWILCLDLLSSPEWVLYSVIDGVIDKLPCTDRTAGWSPRPIQLIVWGPDSGLHVY